MQMDNRILACSIIQPPSQDEKAGNTQSLKTKHKLQKRKTSSTHASFTGCSTAWSRSMPGKCRTLGSQSMVT
ncbi:hypothetical protein PVAP13_1NG075950 [Panicum virgatum]|uniref:Uncharacterized protein n=1 Tax=Panicum virgatum TaxID=38727 RepID=A0A8T0WUY5_PANVG|nr:hypothetical protein PVAP13_1NG075950 [Panicum virgatum]